MVITCLRYLLQTPTQTVKSCTSGSLGAGSLHSGPGVGLGPVDSSPPRGLAEASGCRRQLGDGGFSGDRNGAAGVLEGVSALSGVRAGHGGVAVLLYGGYGSRGEHCGGFGVERRGGEVLNGWHWNVKRTM